MRADRRGAHAALAILAAISACAGGSDLRAGSGEASAPRVSTRRSGYQDMSPALRAIQDDDASNPAMLWVADGEAAWVRADGEAVKSCSDCHGAIDSMRGVAARYPAWDEALAAPVTLSGRIALCRSRHQRVAASNRGEPDRRLALEAAIAMRSRGLPISPPADPRLDAARRQGKALFEQRIGGLNLSCAQCHDGAAGRRLGGAMIPQAMPTGYPIYRLEWQSMGSLARRIDACLAGVRAAPVTAADETALESHLMKRAARMAIDAPGVRP